MSSFPTELPTLWKVIERLDRASIPYMLTGSLALNFYGHVRATNDIDMVIQVHPSDANRIYQLFAKDFYVAQVAIDEALNHEGMFNVIDNEHVFKVDLIVAKKDPFSQQQFARRRLISIGDRKISVITPEDLIIAKLEWSQESLSQLQENDIRNIIKASGKMLDRKYLDEWSEQRGVKRRLERIYASV